MVPILGTGTESEVELRRMSDAIRGTDSGRETIDRAIAVHHNPRMVRQVPAVGAGMKKKLGRGRK